MNAQAKAYKNARSLATDLFGHQYCITKDKSHAHEPEELGIVRKEIPYPSPIAQPHFGWQTCDEATYVNS